MKEALDVVARPVRPRLFSLFLLLLALHHSPAWAQRLAPAESGAETFADAVVSIGITEDDRISVDKDTVIVFHDPLERDSRKTRQVRWVMRCEEDVVWPGEPPTRCLRAEELIVIRPKGEAASWAHRVFRNQRRDAPWRGCLIIPGRYNSATSGRTLSPPFGDRQNLTWSYSIELWRDGALVTELDPDVWIERDEG